jgi:hypothetical protein
MTTSSTPQSVSTAPAAPALLTAARRTNAQRAAAAIDKEIDRISDHIAERSKLIADALDATKSDDGKTILTRAQVLAEFGQRQNSVAALLAQLPIPATASPATAQPAAPKSIS